MRPVVVRRSMLLGGLRLMLGRPGAVVWTYLASLGIALLFSLRMHAQLASLLDHSMAAERLNGAFDIPTAGAVFLRMYRHAPSAGATPYLGLPVYFLVYFLLVPGALFCYRAGAPAKLRILFSTGFCFFWRFARITLLTVLVSGIVLAPFFIAQNLWSNHVDEHIVGVAAIYAMIPGYVVILLVASVLRLYFDLVEVYTVQLDDQYRANGKPDRRVRKALIPAWKALWWNLPRALGTFVVVGLAGIAAIFFTGRIAVDMLAQPRVWPAFLLMQAGLLVSLAARFWQRGAETILAGDSLLPAGAVLEDGAALAPRCSAVFYPTPVPVVYAPPVVAPIVPSRPVLVDPLPNPEPAVPPLRRGDSGMFRVPSRESDDIEG